MGELEDHIREAELMFREQEEWPLSEPSKPIGVENTHAMMMIIAHALMAILYKMGDSPGGKS